MRLLAKFITALGIPNGYVLTAQSGQAVWQPSSGGGGSVHQAEIDFGPLPVAEGAFVVSDPTVTSTSRIIGSVAYEAPSAKDLDELEMDALDLKFAPGDGQLTIWASGREGYVADKFKINYLVV
jgi:hypothetical protein